MGIRPALSAVAYAAALVFSFALSASAGGLAPAEVEPAVVPAAAPPVPVTDWSGFYGGLSYAQGRGSDTYFVNGFYDKGPLDLEGGVPGLFAGYNFQRGRLVFGGELAASFGKIEGVPPGYDEQDITALVDLKGRVGYATGRLMVYGALGYSYSQLTEDYLPSEDTWLEGFGYGLGVDYRIGSRFFVGMEYYRREATGPLDYAPFWEIRNGSVETLSLRAGMRF